MTDYRDQDLELPGGKDIGDDVDAAEVGLDTINTTTGACTYQEPGWGANDTCIEYADGAFGFFADTFASHSYDKRACSFADPPEDDPAEILVWRTASNRPASLWVEPDGTVSLVNQDDEKVSTTVDLTGVWWRPIFEINSDAGYAWCFIRDHRNQLIDTLRIPCGQQDIESFREGCIDAPDGFAIRFSTVLTTDDPLYQDVWDTTPPNVVCIVLDDASPNELPHMEQFRDLAAHGVTFTNNIVSTALCSPSRASYMSGKYPHNNGVMTNNGMGEWRNDPTNELHSALALARDAGYRTFHAGKYYNGYNPAGRPDGNPPYPAEFVPVGYDEAYLVDDGTGGFDYVAVHGVDGVTTTVDTTGGDPEEADFLTDVISDLAVDFIDRTVTERPGQPFFMWIAPYTPHNGIGADPEDGGGYKVTVPPAPRDRIDSANRPAGWGAMDDPVNGDLGDGQVIADIPWPDYAGPLADQLPNWNTHPINKPGWFPDDVVDAPTLAQWHLDYLNRVRAVQSVNDLIAAVRAQLEDSGVDGNTIIMVSTDNGYTQGEHGIHPDGKGTPYNENARLPMVVWPKGGLDAPVVCDELVQNIDLLPTLIDYAQWHAPADLDGMSWRGYVEGSPPVNRRQTALIQWAPDSGNWETALGSGEPAAYFALRSRDALFVNYNDRGDDSSVPNVERGEAYALPTDPAMLNNIWAELPAYKQIGAQTLLQQFINGAGPTSILAQLQAFSLAGDVRDIGEPVYVAAGVDMMDPAGRWKTLIEGTILPGQPGKAVVDYAGTYGLQNPTGPSVPNKSVGPGFITLNQEVTDLDQLGRPSGRQGLAANKTAMLMPYGSGNLGTFVLGERPAPGQPVEWETDAEVLADLAPTRFGPAQRKIAIPIRTLKPWRSTAPLTWSIKFKGNIGIQHVYTLAGSAAPIVGALVRVAGPFSRFSLTDLGSGMIMYCDPVGGVDEGDFAVFDTHRWIAKVQTTDTWSLEGGTDISDTLDTNFNIEELWVLEPTAYSGDPLNPTAPGGDPFDRRIYITGEGVGRTDSTRLEIRAYKTRHA